MGKTSLKEKTETETKLSFKLKLGLATGALAGSVIIPLSCVALGPGGYTSNNNSNTNQCSGSCDGETVNIDIEGATLTLTALSARNQLISKLKCKNGDLTCGGSSTNTNSSSCCRQTTYTIDSFSFISEGRGGCSGGGSSTGGRSSDICISKEDGFTKSIQEVANEADQAKCLPPSGETGNCGFEITGSGQITINECPGKCNSESTITWTKTCRQTNVEGLLDKYKITATGNVSQSCFELSTSI